VALFSASLSPLGTASYTLRYRVDEHFDFAGTQLELNGVERGVVHPERIPLDAPYTPDIDVVLGALEGKVFESTRVEDHTRLRIEVVRAHVSRNSISQGERAPYGHLFVELEAIVTVLDSFGSALIQNGRFRLDANGMAYEPENFLNDSVGQGLSGTFPVVYALPDDTRQASLRCEVGWDSDTGAEWQSADIAFGP
jgi:hypothetical protein